jgi:hypothetical protein
MRKPLLAIAAASLALVALIGTAAPPASAAGTDVINVLQCDADGGTTAVGVGDLVSVRLPGYAQGTYGLIRDFLLKERTTLTVFRNGTTTNVDLTKTWSDPQELDTHLWVTREPALDLGSLSSGESISVTWQVTFAQPLLVAFPPVGPTGDNGPFLINSEGPASCMITVG